MRPAYDEKKFTFQTGWRTRFYEADLQGVIHHAEIIKYLEIGRVEYWRKLGIGYQDFLDSGYQYVVAKVECGYLKPLHFDENITIKVRVSQKSRTSLTYEYLIFGPAGDCAIHATTVLVCLKSDTRRPHALPDEYILRIENYEVKDSIIKSR
jgi:acyl-CoA thioester hydrolase